MGKLRLTAETDAQKKVLAYLEENASDALTEKINNGNKTMADCWLYIRKEARKKALNQVAVIEDVEVYGWAVHYFEEDDIPVEKSTTTATSQEYLHRAAEQEKERAAIDAARKAEEERKKAEKEEAERKLAEQAAAAKAQKERERAEREARRAEEEERKRREREEKKTGAAAGQFSLFDLFGGEG